MCLSCQVLFVVRLSAGTPPWQVETPLSEDRAFARLLGVAWLSFAFGQA